MTARLRWAQRLSLLVPLCLGLIVGISLGHLWTAGDPWYAGGVSVLAVLAWVGQQAQITYAYYQAGRVAADLGYRAP